MDLISHLYAEPFSNQRGLVATFNLHRDLNLKVKLARALLVNFHHCGMAADFAAHTHRSYKTHLIEAFVHTHIDAFNQQVIALGKVRQHRQGQKAVSYGATKGSFSCSLWVYMNKLSIQCAFGKLIDLVLSHLKPVGRLAHMANILSYFRFFYNLWHKLGPGLA